MTVVIPCHNSGALLWEGLGSLWNQQGDVSIEEIIIVSDRSDDVTRREIDKVSTRSGVRVVENDGPPGPGAARNKGWKEARTEWIAFLDADDLLVPESLSLRFDVLARYPDVKWIGGEFFLWWENLEEQPQPFFSNRETTRRLLGLSSNDSEPVHLVRPVGAFLQSALASLCATLVHREVLENLGGFDESLLWVEDYEFSIRAALQYDFIFVPEPLFYYRQHSESTTNKPASWPPKYWHEKAFLRLYGDTELVHYRRDMRSRLSRFALENSFFYRNRGNWRKAVRAALAACRWEPTKATNWRNFIAAVVGR